MTKNQTSKTKRQTRNLEKPKFLPAQINERKFVKNLFLGMTQADAYLAVFPGVSHDSAEVEGCKLHKRLSTTKIYSEMMDKFGLTDERLTGLLEKMLLAEETKFFQHEGAVTDERNVADNGTRLRALHEAFVLKGKMPSTGAAVTTSTDAEGRTKTDVRIFTGVSMPEGE